jgi:hypothetical protein
MLFVALPLWELIFSRSVRDDKRVKGVPGLTRSTTLHIYKDGSGGRI